MTARRRLIARVLSEAEDHPDVEELYQRASALDASISLATVYRTVKVFESAGVVSRLDFGDGRARYEVEPRHHHDHLIDTKTGEVIEFHNEEIERLQVERDVAPSGTDRVAQPLGEREPADQGDRCHRS